jgi:hypothetical protein
MTKNCVLAGHVLFAVGLGVLPACDDAPTDRPTLLATRVEAPGTNCPTGGSAVLAGRDVDGDSVLADSEVESTVYVCRPEAGRTGSMVTGSVSIWNQGDVDALAGVKFISGDLVLEADSITALTFPDLESVGGAIRLGQANDVSVLTFTKLATVGSIESGDVAGIETVELPALTKVDASIDLLVTRRASFPLLSAAGSFRVVVENTEGTLGSVLAPELLASSSVRVRIANSPVAIDFAKLNEVTAEEEETYSHALEIAVPSDADYTLPQLTTAASARFVGHLASFPKLTRVSGSFKVGSATSSLPELTHIDGTLVLEQGAVSFAGPKLVSIGGLLAATASNGSGQSLTTLSLPELTTVDSSACTGSTYYCQIQIRNTPLTALVLPKLATLAVSQVGIVANSALTTVSIPVTRPRGNMGITVTGNAALNDCVVRTQATGWLTAGAVPHWTGTSTISDNGMTCVP